jgi:hypothetical protein
MPRKKSPYDYAKGQYVVDDDTCPYCEGRTVFFRYTRGMVEIHLCHRCEKALYKPYVGKEEPATSC